MSDSTKEYIFHQWNGEYAEVLDNNAIKTLSLMKKIKVLPKLQPSHHSSEIAPDAHSKKPQAINGDVFFNGNTNLVTLLSLASPAEAPLDSLSQINKLKLCPENPHGPLYRFKESPVWSVAIENKNIRVLSGEPPFEEYKFVKWIDRNAIVLAADGKTKPIWIFKVIEVLIYKEPVNKPQASDSINEIVESAINCVAEGQFKLGYLLQYKNDRPDLKRAVTFYELAAKQGNADAQFHLALCQFHGIGTPRDLNKSLVNFACSALQGNADAQYNAAGIVGDYALLAEQGDVVACYNFALCKEHGLGTPSDPEGAVAYYSLAADKGFAMAQNMLGRCKELGFGCEPDPKEAVEYYIRAARQGYPEAQFNLERCQELGFGTIGTSIDAHTEEDKGRSMTNRVIHDHEDTYAKEQKYIDDSLKVELDAIELPKEWIINLLEKPRAQAIGHISTKSILARMRDDSKEDMHTQAISANARKILEQFFQPQTKSNHDNNAYSNDVKIRREDLKLLAKEIGKLDKKGGKGDHNKIRIDAVKTSYTIDLDQSYESSDTDRSWPEYEESEHAVGHPGSQSFIIPQTTVFLKHYEIIKFRNKLLQMGWGPKPELKHNS